MKINYIERDTGEKCVEEIYGLTALSLLYGDGLLNHFLSRILIPIVCRHPAFSDLYGYLQKRSGSKKKIDPFIKAYGIDRTEFAEDNFSSFNDFFIRKLRPECRPLVDDPTILALPADGRYFVYPKISQFFVKGTKFTLGQFLSDRSETSRYAHGSMAIVRLCPSDYHRFHFPCDGTPSKARLINGPLYSVNPMALRKRISILFENKRMMTEIETEEFGTILYIEIGATSVGTIKQTFVPDRAVKKGDEKGYFEFGGSCLVLLFEPGRIEFDRDLIRNTERGLETRANFGGSLGRSLG